MRLLVALLAALAALPGAAQTPAVTFFVATGGRDTWSGRLPDPNAAGTDGPFASLASARDAIRALKQAGPLPAGGVAVHVRAGTYEVPHGFQLAAADAGTEQAPIVYRAQPGEAVTLTAARRITGFVPHRGQVWRAELAAQGLSGVYFRQLYYGGRRQHLARYPNFDPQNPHGGGFAYEDGRPLSMYTDLPVENLRTLHLKAKDVREWAHPERGEVILFPRYNWTNMAVPIAAADPAQGTITLGRDVAWGPFKGIRPLDRFYVRNLPEELDSPGEWYLDQATWTLYFWPPGAIEGAEIRAPFGESIVELGPGADWITIRGFTLQGCEASAVLVKSSSHCRIVGNTVHDCGGRLGYSAGIQIQGGRDCGVVGNDLSEICNYGIRLESERVDVEDLVPTGHFADNNYLHHIGVLNGHGCGIYLSGIALRASHNLIHDTTRCGIFGGGPDCVVEYNHLRHVNLETEDTGGYYVGGNWHIRGLVVRYNWIHDVLGYGRSGDRWTSPHFTWGIYLDDDHSGAHVYGNIVARTTLGGSHIHAGRDNVLENNIFIDHANQQMQYSGHDPQSWVVASHREQFRKGMERPAWQERYPELAKADVDSLYLMAGNKFRRNIICYRGPQAKLYQYSRNDVPEQNASDYNLIWHYGLPLHVGLPGIPAEQQWAAWQQKGFDTHSVVADPLFVDPEHDDYRLRPESPAFRLGFEPIPVEQIGPYASDLRASWPIVEAPGVRETPLVETRVDLPAIPVPPPPEAKAPKVVHAPVLDGAVAPHEYAAPIALAVHPDATAATGPPARVHLAHDGAVLYVAVEVPLQDRARLRLGQAWGSDDAAEVCFAAPAGGKPGPIFVCHGFASGRQECVTEAGAPAEAVARLQAAVRFAARVTADRWTGEWTIPLAAAGLAWQPGLRLPFNAGVRRTESNAWLQWVGSGSTWSVDRAGILVLE